MHKIIVFILLLIVVAASSIPCCTSDACPDEATHTTSTEAPLEEGTCSPFFNCAGCAGFVYVPKPIQVIEPTAERPSYSEKNILFNIAAYSSPFFQPPRLYSSIEV